MQRQRHDDDHRQLSRVTAAWAVGVAAWLAAAAACAQTTIDHARLAYFVAEKRIVVTAMVTDPKGVKLARTYFKAGAQADYTFVPMQSAGANRYFATLPAPAAGTPSIEYIVLAQNGAGAVSRTAAFTVQARNGGETPSWQSSSKAGDLRVFTEAAQAPANLAGFSDSVTLDVVESGARLGAAAGLYGGGSGGAAGVASTATSGAATAATTAGATAGGLSTAAIVGGVVIAGAAAAAAGGGGGGSSATPASPPAPSGAAAYAGNWSGTWTLTQTTPSTACSQPSPPCAGNWAIAVGADGTATVTRTTASSACQGWVGAPFTTTIGSDGKISLGVVSFCATLPLQLTLNPRSAAGTLTCDVSFPGCTDHYVVTYSGQ
jgi:hypothetical protein